MRATIVIASMALVWVGCDEREPTDAGVDAGPPREDAGPELRDAGVDAGEPDAGPLGLDERPANPTCVAPPAPSASIRFEEVFVGVTSDERPIELLRGPGERWWVAIQRGLVLTFTESDPAAPQVALDLTAAVNRNFNATGLLGAALHPDFPADPRVFLRYETGPDDALASRLSSFRTTDGVSFDPSSEVVMFEVPQPHHWHQGGHIEFGPDGMLYTVLGDGGPESDPNMEGQNPLTLLGSMLRLDVDGASPYVVPPDNPFVGRPSEGLPEVWAYGFRNPWRFSFDFETGRLWLGDVGEATWEEINLIVRGGNYGWSQYEGFDCFRASCDPTGLVEPVHVYGRDLGVAVTGGRVYRGDAIPGLRGRYVFADFLFGNVFALDDTSGSAVVEQLFVSPINFGSFTEDRERELLVVGLFPGGFHRLVPTLEADTLPARLSETGCVQTSDPSLPVDGALPYDVAHEFWSDGASKDRFVALPDGAQLTVGADGDLELPPGGVTFKHFRVGGQLVETRFFVRHEDGSYSGYSYAWEPDGSDAVLVSEQTVVPGTGWTIPDRSSCLACHTHAAGRTLGLEARQLDVLQTYPSTGRTANQLDTWQAIGWLDGAAPEGALPSREDVADPAWPRAYLHVNCAPCHQPDGPGRGELDLRFETALADTNACERVPGNDLGIPDARVIAPGSRARSVLFARVGDRARFAMPPIARDVVDADALSALGAWIDGLDGCP